MPKLREPSKKQLTDTPSAPGKRIAIFRKRLGLTQNQLADAVEVSRNVIADYENDRMRIYDEMIARLAIALKVSTDALLGLEKQVGAEEDPLSLRFVKRIRSIQKLPEPEQKAIIKIIDMALKTSE